MSEDKTILFSVKLDTDNLERNAKEASLKLVELKKKQQELKTANQEGGVEYAKLSSEIRDTSKQLKDNASALEINARSVKKDNLSLNQQAELLKASKIAYRNLSEEQRNSAGGKKALKNIDEMNASLKESEKAYGDSQRNVGNYSDAIGGLPGPIGGAVKSIKTMGASLKALLANPVVLVIAGIVAILALLFKAFTRGEEGQNKMAKATAVVSAIFETLMDILTFVAEMLVDVVMKPKESIEKFGKLVKENIVNRFMGLLELIPQLGKAILQLFKGDFEGASKTALDAAAKVSLGVENITSKIKLAGKELEAYNKKLKANAKSAGEIADKRAKADKIDRDLVVKTAETAQKVAQLREDAERKDLFSVAERIEKLKEAQKLDLDNTNKQIASAKLRFDAKVKENSLAASTKEDLNEEAQLKAVMISLDAERIQSGVRLTTKIQGMQAQQIQDSKNLVKANQDANAKILADQNSLLKALQDLMLDTEDKTNEKQASIIEARYEVAERLARNNTDQLIELEIQKNADLTALDVLIQEDKQTRLKTNFDREVKENKGNLSIQEELKKQFELDKEAIELDFKAKTTDRDNKTLDKSKEHNSKRLENEQKTADELALINAELNLKNSAGLSNEQEMFRAFQNEKIRIIQENALREIELNSLVGAEAEKVRAKALLDVKNVEGETFTAKVKTNQKTLTANEQQAIAVGQASLNSASQLSGALFQLKQNGITEELNAEKEKSEALQENLKAQLDAGLIDKAKFDELSAKANAELRLKERKLKEEQFKAQKTASLIQAGINIALGVTQALAGSPPPLSFILAGTTAAMGALEVGAILSAPTPKFEKGGQFGGQSHANGGTKGVFSDGTQIEVEAGENFYILNKNASKSIAGLSALNVAHGGSSFYEGGKSSYATGGIVANLDNQFANQNNLINMLKLMPSPIVVVQDINDAQGNLANVMNRASF